MDEHRSSASLEQRHADFLWIARRFQLHTDTSREMLNELVPQMDQRDVQRLSPESLASSATSLPESQREKLKAIIADAYDRADRASEDGQDVAPEADLTPIFANDQHSLARFLDGLSRAMSEPSRQMILLNSLLAMAVSEFEVLVSSIVARYFIAHPQALDDREARFSLSDLASFDDLDDARDVLISKRITDLMYGGVEDWGEWFRKTCGADWTLLALDHDELLELFQRRHLVMHNGGVVSHLYLQRVPDTSRPVKLGDRLVPDMDYMNAALDQLDVLGHLLVLLAWGTWKPADRDLTASLLLDRSYFLMLRGRWRAVAKLCEVGKKLRAPEAMLCAIRCNGWHARAVLEGRAAIADDVRRWDTSAHRGRFQLVKHALLGEVDEAARLVPVMLEQDEIAPGALAEWPILSDLREHPDVLPLISG